MSDDSDIAVIEYLPPDGGEPKVLAYVGENRSGGLIDEYFDDSIQLRTCELRVRYLNREEDT